MDLGHNAGRTRALSGGAALVALAGALAGAAAAGARAPAPVRFRVTIAASQSTSWSVSQTDACGELTGGGQETATYRTPRAQTVGVPALLDGLRSPLSIVVRATRTGTLQETFSGGCRTPSGNCAAGNLFVSFAGVTPFDVPCGAPVVADTSRCGSAQATVPAGSGLYLGYSREPGDPRRVLDVQLAVEASLWGTGCPGWLARRPAGIFDSAAMPLQTLKQRRMTVLRGGYDCPPECSQHQEGVTLHAAWTVRFERLPAPR